MKRIVCIILLFSVVFTAFCSCKSRSEEEEFARAMAEYRLSKLEAYEEENQKFGDFEVDAVFLGDSLTDGYDLGKYYPDLLVLNRGIGGDTTVGLEERLGVSVYDVVPKVAVMLIGANNMREMFENYEDILVGLRNNLPNTKIILLSLTSMSGNWGKNNQLAAYNNVKIKKLAEKYSYDFVDLYSPLMNLETGEIFAEYTTDGGHLTDLGYEVLTAEITPALERQLALWHAENGR